MKVLKQNLANKLEIAQSSYGVVQKTLSQISSFVNLNPSGPPPSENINNNNSNIINNNNFNEDFQGNINPDLLNLNLANKSNSNDNISNEISSKLNNNASESINVDDWDESNLN